MQKLFSGKSFLYSASPKFAETKEKYMATESKNRVLMWLLFFVSVAALVIAIVTHWPWLTLILPFNTTFLVKAMNII